MAAGPLLELQTQQICLPQALDRRAEEGRFRIADCPQPPNQEAPAMLQLGLKAQALLMHILQTLQQCAGAWQSWIADIPGIPSCQAPATAWFALGRGGVSQAIECLLSWPVTARYRPHVTALCRQQQLLSSPHPPCGPKIRFLKSAILSFHSWVAVQQLPTALSSHALSLKSMVADRWSPQKLTFLLCAFLRHAKGPREA